ncbi:MAG: RluA family pseudouridine synthase [Deltaproteobacteria bacterium]|nr:RluA family pseudouridine synthase [Deltaproteobacteria bacterium]MBW1928650.1 RluA family pseudouridine synthase [Deltaproteobacteria bacterium]MBW2025815.1 RluA family pseudouridine synthase [Deltaproteobacteria bacterium]MBW2125952.1 RluA family pseudouridine synthase [Deltaproteobacteria bacterium]
MDLNVAREEAGKRLDIFLGAHAKGLSRARIQQLIRSGAVHVNNSPSKPSYKVREGDHVVFSIPPPQLLEEITPEKVPFDILFEDHSLLVLSKPPGVVVHPAPGHTRATLVHGLLNHCKDLSGIGGTLRPGIVHRLDKDTSGVMVVAKTDAAHQDLARQFKEGQIKKEYHALVHGVPKAVCGSIELPIGRHPKKRKEMAVTSSSGRPAITEWKKIREYGGYFSLLSVHIKTGRTHQIRVHLSYMGHPVAGDPVYGYGKNWWKGRRFSPQKIALGPVGRQMLHARRLGFHHPVSKAYMTFEVEYPQDMQDLLKRLEILERA